MQHNHMTQWGVRALAGWWRPPLPIMLLPLGKGATGAHSRPSAALRQLLPSLRHARLRGDRRASPRLPRRRPSHYLWPWVRPISVAADGPAAFLRHASSMRLKLQDYWGCLCAEWELVAGGQGLCKIENRPQEIGAACHGTSAANAHAMCSLLCSRRGSHASSCDAGVTVRHACAP